MKAHDTIGAVAKDHRAPSPVDEFAAAFGRNKKHLGRISPELVELLLAYGRPPKMPTFKGDAVEYAAAVTHFIRLSSTPEAMARTEALRRYFEARWGARKDPTDGSSWGS